MHAEITATNPAHRIVDVTISDSIFEGAIGSSTLATALSGTNPKTFPLTSVDPESSVTLVHEIEVANGSANIYSDKATAKYTDHAFPDVTIPGQTEATAQANVVVNTSNANSSVVVTDLESISATPTSQYRIEHQLRRGDLHVQRRRAGDLHARHDRLHDAAGAVDLRLGEPDHDVPLLQDGPRGQADERRRHAGRHGDRAR